MAAFTLVTRRAFFRWRASNTRNAFSADFSWPAGAAVILLAHSRSAVSAARERGPREGRFNRDFYSLCAVRANERDNHGQGARSIARGVRFGSAAAFKAAINYSLRASGHSARGEPRRMWITGMGVGHRGSRINWIFTAPLRPHGSRVFLCICIERRGRYTPTFEDAIGVIYRRDIVIQMSQSTARGISLEFSSCPAADERRKPTRYPILPRIEL